MYNKNNIKQFLYVTAMTCSIVACKSSTENTKIIDVDPSKSSQVNLSDAQLGQAEISTSLLEKMSISPSLQLNGKMEVSPEYAISISVPVSGRILKMPWMSGMKISKGQTIVVLEDKMYIQLQQEYLETKSAVYFAEKEYQRQKDLTKNQATSEKALLQSEEQYQQKKIGLASLGQQLRYIHIDPKALTTDNIRSSISIPSPVSGYISDVKTNSGKYLNTGEEIIKILDVKGLNLVAKIFEKDLPYVKQGNVVTAWTNGNPNRKITGKVTLIGSQIQHEGFADVICSLSGTPVDFKPGLFINAEINGIPTEQYLTDEEAIVHFQGKDYIFIEGGKGLYRREEVKIGMKRDKKAVITDGEKWKNEKIVVRGAYTLLMKMENVAE